jgi:isopentenyl diphosphate isomerase/L-lactate dehydrogenase-like FMN-dependent dehydrogenase
MVDITNVPNTMSTSILGYNFSAPFFISPCARGGYGHPGAEANIVKAAGAENILYMPSQLSTLSMEEIGAARNSTSQVTFQQVYLTANDTVTKEVFARAEKAGSKAFVFTIDSAADGNRHRAIRFGVGSANTDYDLITWEYYRKIRTFTKLPIILKGIQTVEDAKLAVANRVPGILLSNHGGRQLDGTPSSLEIALEIYNEDPNIFQKIEVYADGGVRYGADILRLLALGVKAVGIGRPIMFANVYGEEGVARAITLLKREVAIDAGNLGVGDLKKINPSFVNWTPNNWQG